MTRIVLSLLLSLTAMAQVHKPSNLPNTPVVLYWPSTSFTIIPNDLFKVPISMSVNSGENPVSLQFILTFDSTKVSSVLATVSPITSAAGKSLTCMSQPGKYSCILMGTNTNKIPSGIVVYAFMKFSSPSPVSIKLPMSRNSEGVPIPTSAGPDLQVK